ncbi:M16 family metallopeptidase [Frigidibacter sp. MR17.24]|uniref:M16 family metallopeptidase n=1 Tax=Frigidibacter sp. MR17.24 TaxID=3127345 RepID=UPI0030130ED9
MALRHFGAAVLSACALSAGIGPAAQAGEISDFTLENGLQVVVIEDHRAPAVTQMIYYKAGAADEQPGKSGIAHFLEHLMFKGTDKVGPKEFSRIVESLGGSDNAFTTSDYTGYYQRVSAANLDRVMEMEADRMRGLKLSQSDVDTERQVILEERSQRIDNDPGALFNEQRQAAQYLNHHYRIPIIGWRHEMEGLTREDALEWYRTYYAPNNAVLVVAGDVTPDAVRGLAEKYYGPIAPTEGLAERARPQEPPQIAERRVTYADPRVSRPYVMRTYLAPERDAGDQKEAAALTVLAELLGGDGQTSVLGRKLTFDSKTALYTSAFYDATSLDDTTFGVVIMPLPGIALADAEAALDTALDAFMAEGVDPAQLERVKTQVRAAEIYAQDSVAGLARKYGEALTSGLTMQDVADWPAALQAVTAEDVMAAAKDVLNRDHAVTGWLQTKPGAPEAVTPASAPMQGNGEVLQ